MFMCSIYKKKKNYQHWEEFDSERNEKRIVFYNVMCT